RPELPLNTLCGGHTMADVEIKVEEETAEKELNPFLEATRKVLLAGVGVVALAQEEAESFVNKLVERGELAEKDGRQLIKDILEKRKKAVEQVEEVDLDVRIE